MVSGKGDKLNIERKYIAETINSMNERIEHLKVLMEIRKQAFDKCDERLLDVTESYNKGHFEAYEEELEFLKRQIQFLKGALEN